MLESLLTSVNVDCRPRSFSSCVGLLCGGGEGGGTGERKREIHFLKNTKNCERECSKD